MSEIDISRHPGSQPRRSVRTPGSVPSSTGPGGSAASSQASACSCDLDTEPGPAGPILVLRVAGEIDLHTLPVLQHALTDALDRRPADLVVDLAAVVFCCVRGVDLLATTAITAQTGRTTYSLSGPPSNLDRTVSLLWPEEPFLRYRSAAAAVTALRTEHTFRST